MSGASRKYSSATLHLSAGVTAWLYSVVATCVFTLSNEASRFTRESTQLLKHRHTVNNKQHAVTRAAAFSASKSRLRITTTSSVGMNAFANANPREHASFGISIA